MGLFAYGGLGDSSGMRHVCSRGRCLFHGDSCTSRITADQVRPATPANHRFLSNNPTYRCLVNPRTKRGSLPRVLIRSYMSANFALWNS